MTRNVRRGRWAAAGLGAICCLAASAAADDGWQFVLEFGSGTSDIAVDSSHNVYVLSRGREWIQVFTPEGQFLRDRTGLDRPTGIAIDENDVIYVIVGRCTVGLLDTDLQPLGHFDSCIGLGDLRGGLGIDVRNGVVYVASVNSLLRFTTDGTFLGEFYSPGGWGDVSAVADGSVWCVRDYGGLGLVRHYSPEGLILDEWNTILLDENVSDPRGITMDSLGRIFVADEGARVKIFRPDGTLDDLIQWQLRIFTTVELDGDHVLYVGAAFPDAVMKFQLTPVAVDPMTWGAVKTRFR